MQNAQNSVVTDARADEAEQAGGLVGLFNTWCRHIALLAAWIATCGSLFFSEVLGWQPCLFCWYQRILMYPLAIILTVGILRNDRGVAAYVLPFSIAGIFMSTYHYLLIRAPRFFPPPPCTDGVPCTVDYINWLGFINIPTLALFAFLIISITMGNYLVLTRNNEEPTSPSSASMVALAVIAITVFSFVGLAFVM
jgi:disulfide bond formation protein DsbB